MSEDRSKPGKLPVQLRKSRKYPHVNWKVDYDYLHKLDDKALKWLAEFTGAQYLSGYGLPGDMQREAWREFKRNSNDLVSRGGAFGLQGDEPVVMLPLEPVPDQESKVIDHLDKKRAKCPEDVDYDLATFNALFGSGK